MSVIVGDCIEVMRRLEAGSVQTCVTSPPYFGLRDYGHEGQIGLEPTPAEFVARLVEVFGEVHRLLRDDGTLWLNLGDSYAANRGYQVASTLMNGDATNQAQAGAAKGMKASALGLKEKDLIGIPWRVAFALQEAGWYLRQDIIWAKPNPMPESVRDRCTKAHEYLFLLSKSPRYYFDAEAIKEPAAPSSLARWAQDVESQAGSDRVPGKTNGRMKAVGGRSPGNVNPPKGQLAYEAGDERHRTKAGLLAYAERHRSARDSFKREGSKREAPIPGQSVGTHRPDREESQFDTETRNKRSVWTVATMPFREAHFATFPEALIEPCILAGSRAGDTVLDPFMGAGTTAVVATRLGRQYVGAELNPDYARIAEARIRAVQPGLALGSVA